MSNKIVECVPNFSEGRDETIINAIRDAIASVEGVTILDVSPGVGDNRTIYTFVGHPDVVVEAALRCARVGLEHIDMRHHTGVHKRMGALDVCPFIPIAGVTMKDCVKLAEQFGERFADEMGIPTYLYAEAARTPERVSLPDIRKGEYEALPEKLRLSEWIPDYGPNVFNPRSGATATGARHILIAYNVNLASANENIAKEIAGVIRTSGAVKRDETGNVVRDKRGKALRIPGRLKCIQAGGWLYNSEIAQVTMNLLEYAVTGIHTAYEEVKKEAAIQNIDVTGSELKGLAPKEAFLLAGKFYAPEETDGTVLISAAVENLGLNDLGHFDPHKKIIEYRIKTM